MDDIISYDNIEHINVLKHHDIITKYELYVNSGINALKNNKIGLVLLAGGQGSRLGSDRSKGVLNVGIKNNLTIFQILIRNIIDIIKEIDKWLYLFVMVSPQNHDEIYEYFKSNNYFGYDMNFVLFFQQDVLPAVDGEDKIILTKDNKQILLPDGNGGWFNALIQAGHGNLINKKGIEWLNVFSVDNVLQKIADPTFIGATIMSSHNCGAKVVKKIEGENVGVICLHNGLPYIIEYFELSKLLSDRKEPQSTSIFEYGVILNYLFSVSQLETISKYDMPLHKIKKDFLINDETIISCLNKSNTYKLEYLLTDMIPLMGSCLPYEIIREKEFAPIKNKHGKDSVETAQELLLLNGYEI